MRIKKIDIPIYYGSLIIVVSDKYPDVAKKFGLSEDVDRFGAFVWTRQDSSGITEFLICIDEEVENHLIAHETVHLVNAIFEDKGIQLDRSNDEPQAYLTGWVFKQIEDFVNNKAK